MDQIKIGEFISMLRKEQGMTQATLAEKLSISNRTISKWENGDGLPDITILPDLANALGVTTDELLAGERKDIAQIKVTEIESQNTVLNCFQITYIVSFVLGSFAAILGFITLAYNSWAFNILFYNHWEIVFLALSLLSEVMSIMFFCIGVTKLKLNSPKMKYSPNLAKRDGYSV